MRSGGRGDQIWSVSRGLLITDDDRSGEDAVDQFDCAVRKLVLVDSTPTTTGGSLTTTSGPLTEVPAPHYRQRRLNLPSGPPSALPSESTGMVVVPVSGRTRMVSAIFDPWSQLPFFRTYARRERAESRLVAEDPPRFDFVCGGARSFVSGGTCGRDWGTRCVSQRSGTSTAARGLGPLQLGPPAGLWIAVVTIGIALFVVDRSPRSHGHDRV